MPVAIPLKMRQMPGGGTGVAEAMAGVSGDIQKDIQAKKMLEMPGLTEGMGADTATWIKSGPGVHKRLGQYLQHADRATGGKVTRIRQALDIASQRFGGKMPANQQEALRGWMTAVDQVNRSGRGAPIERDEAMKIFEQGWSRLSGKPSGFTLGPGQKRFGPGGEEIAAGEGRETVADIISRARQDPQFMALAQSGKQWKQLTPEERMVATSALTGQTSGDAVMRAQRIFGTPTLMEQLMGLGGEGGAADLDAQGAPSAPGAPGAPTTPPAAPGTDLSDEEADRLIGLGRGR